MPKKKQKRKTQTYQKRAKVLTCHFCDNNLVPSYSDPGQLDRFITTRAKIVGKRSGLCAKHQRRLATAVKRARFLALLPFKMSL